MSAIRLRKQSLDAEFDRRIKSDPLTRLVFEWLFELQNAVRVLEGKQPATRAQVLQAARQRFKGE